MENLDTIIDIAVAANDLNSSSWFAMEEPETFNDDGDNNE